MLIPFLLMMSFFGDEFATYGAPVKKETPVVSIEKLTKNPEAYLDKVIKVVGRVQAVCPKMGCWLDVSADDNKVRVKVKDGEIVFDQELVGKRIVAEGTVYKFELSKEEAVKYYRHLAEENGENFDPASVTSGKTIYQIGGLGVAVLDI